MAKTDAKQLAHVLFMETDMTQREIAEQVKVSEKTMSNWVNAEDWVLKKAANTVTRNQLVVNYLLQLKALHDKMMSREAGERIYTNAETDRINKITKAIETLEKNVTLSEYIAVCTDLSKYMAAVEPNQAKQMLPTINEFIQQKAKELQR